MNDRQAYRARYDAVIVGARCAGAATAMLLARSGASVLLIDRQKYGTDVVSTHALMRGGVLQLNRWGVLPRLIAAGTPEVRRTTFHYGDEEIPVAIKSEHGVDYLCAPRRTVLDRILVDAAVDAGVEVRHGVSLTDLRRADDGRVTGVDLKDPDIDGTVAVNADMVVGADGRQSTVARLVEAPFTVEGMAASGYVYGYFENLADDGYHWYFGRDVAAGIIPTNHLQHCVFVGVPLAEFAKVFRGNLDGGFRQVARANAAALAEQVDDACLVGRLRGFAGSPGYLRQAYGPGWALVGDAGYFKDPLTAHGITDALRDAELLARAVSAGTTAALAEYQGIRDALSKPLLAITDAIASFDWTLDEAKAHHADLSDAMKPEVEHIAGLSATDTLAA